MKKGITVTEKNFSRIAAELAEVQKLSKVRTITLEDIRETLAEVEKHLSLPKTYLTGIKVRCDINAQDFPNAYKYRPESTHFTAVYRAWHWTVTDIYRDTTRRNKPVIIELTDAAKEKILENMSYMKYI